MHYELCIEKVFINGYYRLVPLKCGVICRAAALLTADARDGSSYKPISSNGIGLMAEHAVNGFHDSAENALS